MADSPAPPDPLAWTILDRTAVRDYRIFRSQAVRARHPVTGAERSFTVLDVPDWVNVIALTPERRVVLVRQYRHGAARVHLEIPGGMVDPDEDHATAARRELVEETGFTAPRWIHLGSVEPNPAIQGNRLHTWLALDAAATEPPRPDAGEVLDVSTAQLTEVITMVRDGRIDHALVVVAFAHLTLHHPELTSPDR